MNQSNPICVLYLSDASNNKENGRMKIENSDDHTHFFCSTNFLPSQKNCYLVKGEYDTCQLILTKQVLKHFDCLHITVRYHKGTPL